MDFSLKNWFSKHFLLLIIIGIGIAVVELQALPIESASPQAATDDGELELSAEQRKELLDLAVNFLIACKEAKDLENENGWASCLNATNAFSETVARTNVASVLNSKKGWRESEELSAELKQFLTDLEAAAKDGKELTEAEREAVKSFFADEGPKVNAKSRKTIKGIIDEARSMLAEPAENAKEAK